MRSMVIDRRSFLRLGAAGLAAAAFPRAFAAAAERELFVAAAASPDGGFVALLIDETGKTLASAPIATRGHDAAADPVHRRAVLFARRPGQFAVVIHADGAPPTLFAPPGDRVFNGHGAFSPDGALLYASENDPAGEGRLGIYDASDGFRRVGELPTFGIGPHEVIVSPEGRRLIVANGGIATDPDVGAGRQKLNRDSMRPSLVEVDRKTGELLNRVELDAGLHELSIRHLAVDNKGGVWFGCQWEGDPVEHPPLVGRVRGEAPPMLVELPQLTLFRARNYVGAVAASRDGGAIAASCPRGGAILTFDAATGRLVGETSLRDSSGVAGSEDGFIATSGEGRVVRYAGGDARDLSASNLKYDNHIRRL
jgi:hypothetical protein